MSREFQAPLLASSSTHLNFLPYLILLLATKRKEERRKEKKKFSSLDFCEFINYLSLSWVIRNQQENGNIIRTCVARVNYCTLIIAQ